MAGDPQGLVRAAAAKLDLDKVASSGVSPEVRIRSSSSTVPDAQISIEATVTDHGGGIGRIEWRNNSKTIEVDTSHATALDGSGRTVALKKTVPLVVGENVIELKAYNAQNLIESESVQVTVNRTEQPRTKSPRPRLYVLAVGVNDYWDSKLRLNFAVPDAKSMADGLQRTRVNTGNATRLVRKQRADGSQFKVREFIPHASMDRMRHDALPDWAGTVN
jgi:hypothetical protein